MWAHRWSPNQGRGAKLRLHGCTDLEELILANKSQMVSQSISDNICIPNVVFCCRNDDVAPTLETKLFHSDSLFSLPGSYLKILLLDLQKMTAGFTFEL